MKIWHSDAEAKRIKSDPGKVKSSVETGITQEELPGSVRIEMVTTDCFSPSISGYDKTLGADVETFFLTNRAAQPLAGFSMDIVYLSKDGAQLHRRHIFRRCDIAPGETCRIDIRSWDKQHSFYYERSNPPRRKATPYKVRFEPQAYFLRKK